MSNDLESAIKELTGVLERIQPGLEAAELGSFGALMAKIGADVMAQSAEMQFEELTKEHGEPTTDLMARRLKYRSQLVKESLFAKEPTE